MKTLKSNFRMIQFAWKGSRAWVICNMLDIIINPLRNLTIDVLLIGYIYNSIQQNQSFSKMIPLFILLSLFYIVNLLFEAVFIGYINPTGDIKIKNYIDELLCKNAATVPLASYDDTDFYNDYIFSAQNCSDVAKQAVTNMASVIAYLLGGLMSIGLIANINPIMVIFIVLAILISFFLASLRKKWIFAIGKTYQEFKQKSNIFIGCFI